MACRGDETARSGYDFVYGGKGRPWPELKELHDFCWLLSVAGVTVYVVHSIK